MPTAHLCERRAALSLPPTLPAWRWGHLPPPNYNRRTATGFTINLQLISTLQKTQSRNRKQKLVPLPVDLNRVF